MGRRTLSEWLRWQESLYPKWIELTLDRVSDVARRLRLPAPQGRVFTVAGTNGKGSTVAFLEAVMVRAGMRPGVYTSPHLIDYNERIRVDARAAGDEEIIDSFERIEQARGDIPLTFFEYGTLAALDVFGRRGCDAWVLEVGMGGRLDAVNVVDADFPIITTVSLDHQEYLGNSVEEIAAEKAGILRAGKPGFYGDWPVPRAVNRIAADTGARLHCLGDQFDFTPGKPTWSWRGQRVVIDGLRYPAAATGAQLRNASVALAALEQFDPRLLADAEALNAVITTARPPGRFQVVRNEYEWILDVAHNPQAVATLREQLSQLPPCDDTTIVLGLLADKDLDAFAVELAPLARRWVCCTVDDPRARNAASIAERLAETGIAQITTAGSAEQAFEAARQLTRQGGRIVICGSFRVVGPGLRQLGIY